MKELRHKKIKHISKIAPKSTDTTETTQKKSDRCFVYIS